ncbi:Transposase, Tn3, partial [mine drainage metagenome]
ETLGFHWLAEPQRRALMRVLREELGRTSDRARLLQFARCWLYEHQLIVPRERELRTMIAKAIRTHERQLARTIVETVDPPLLARWRSTITEPRESGTTVQSWLWAAPAKHSSRQIEEVLERVELLRQLGVSSGT